MDSVGNVYIADNLNYKIRKVDTTGKISTVAGTGALSGAPNPSTTPALATSVLVKKPFGLAIDPNDNLYISDPGNAMVLFLDTKTGYLRAVAGGASSTCNGSTYGDGCPATTAKIGGGSQNGITMDQSGNLYIADTVNNAIRRVTTNTVFPAIGSGSETQVVQVHLAAYETPDVNGFTIASGSGFSIQSSVCSPNADNTTDCLVSVTFSPAVPGAATATVAVNTVNSSDASLGRELTFNVTGTAIDPPPTAYDQTVDTTTNSTGAPVILVASDQFGASLTYTVLSNPTHGTLSGTAPNLTYTPTTGYSGTDIFTFKANNGTDSNVATVNINVAATNHPPVATNVTGVNTAFQTAVAITLTATDADNNALTYSVVSGPAHGSLSAIVGNQVTYTPAAGYSGTESFTFKANDGQADSNVASVSITIAAKPNTAPVASSGAASTSPSAPVTTTLSATDADSDPLTFSVVAGPAHGSVTIAGNQATFTPAAGFAGADAFTFKANDGQADSNVATVTVNVTIPAGQITVSTASLTFLSTTIGQGSSSQVVTVFNQSAANLAVTPSISGDFMVSANGCSVVVAPLGQCNIFVRFVPTTTGARSGQLSVNYAGNGSAPFAVALNGTGGGQVQLSTTSMTFAPLAVNYGSSSQTVNILNLTGATATLSVSMSDPNFIVSASNCQATLAANNGCTVYVRFTPKAVGAQNGTLTVTANGSTAGTVSFVRYGYGLAQDRPDCIVVRSSGRQLGQHVANRQHLEPHRRGCAAFDQHV